MSSRQDLIDLETSGWQALSVGGDRATAFYDEVLDDQPVMLLPGGMLLGEREQILESMSGPPWSSFRLDNTRVITPTTDVGVVVYGVVAQREGQPDYSALISSTYVRRNGRWRMTMHQQTPR